MVKSRAFQLPGGNLGGPGENACMLPLGDMPNHRRGISPPFNPVQPHLTPFNPILGSAQLSVPVPAEDWIVFRSKEEIAPGEGVTIDYGMPPWMDSSPPQRLLYCRR